MSQLPQKDNFKTGNQEVLQRGLPDKSIQKTLEIERHYGTVKFYNEGPGKNYGFIIPKIGDKDIFFYKTAVDEAGYATLNKGIKISYVLEEYKPKTFRAIKLRIE